MLTAKMVEEYGRGDKTTATNVGPLATCGQDPVRPAAQCKIPFGTLGRHVGYDFNGIQATRPQSETHLMNYMFKMCQDKSFKD